MLKSEPLFYSKSTIIDSIKNGGWKVLLLLIIIFLLLILFSNLNFENFKSNWINVTYMIFTILFFLSQFIFGTKELIINNDKIILRRSFSSKMQEYPIENISHVCFYKKPIERGSIFPKAIFPKAILYPLKNHKGTTIEFKIKKNDIYIFLSILQDYGKDVLMFKELKNINDTEYYIPIRDNRITKLIGPKFIINFENQEYKNSVPNIYKIVSKLFYLSLTISIIKLFLTYGDLSDFIFFFNIMAIVFSFGVGIFCQNGGLLNLTKRVTFILCIYFFIEIVYLSISISINNLFCIFCIIQFILMLVALILPKKLKK